MVCYPLARCRPYGERITAGLHWRTGLPTRLSEHLPKIKLGEFVCGEWEDFSLHICDNAIPGGIEQSHYAPSVCTDQLCLFIQFRAQPTDASLSWEGRVEHLVSSGAWQK